MPEEASRPLPAGYLGSFGSNWIFISSRHGERSIDRPVLRHACLSSERWLKISHFHGNRYLLRRRRHSPDITETAAALRSHCTRTMSKEKYWWCCRCVAKRARAGERVHEQPSVYRVSRSDLLYYSESTFPWEKIRRPSSYLFLISANAFFSFQKKLRLPP